ncbi:MAG: HAD family phosphatase [Gammaproteobacteria bacterium]|nr:HAD family phosphatase [Gammaproteobacteria bacterium]
MSRSLNSRPAALLFDLGGVIIDIDFDRVFAQWALHSPLGAADIAQRFRFDATYHRYERGEISDRVFFDEVRRVLQSDAPDATLLAGWNAVFVGLIDDNLALAARLAETLPCYAFTNTSASHQRAWSRSYPSVTQTFRCIYSSAEMGLRKPDRAAFEAVTAAIGCSPESILFFDDMRSNVDGALAAGLRAVHVTHPGAVQEALQAHGLA